MIPEVTRNTRWAHRANIERYRKILRTHLTETERQFIEKRLTEEQQALRQNAQVGVLRPQTDQFETVDES
jgi:hypothetical protein